MPYTRNPFFTGREDTLTRLRELLHHDNPVAITQSAAINGMGGIGKTQTAVEYAYRFRKEYTAVLWIRSENETVLRESFVEIARLLELPEANEQDQNITINAVTRWLTSQSDWLVIMDNADDLAMASQFLPKSHKGCVLFTSRDSVTGRYAKAVSIEKLSIEDGALLLLRRAKRIDETAEADAATLEDLQSARAISEAVDGLPLALDQAGAYIEATKVSPIRYLELYQISAPVLLSEYGDPEDHDHDSVIVTFSLAFEQANKDNSAVGDLLRFCAFMAADDIPEGIFILANKEILGETLSLLSEDKVTWNTFVGMACRYSLLIRNGDKQMLSMHRLVHLVLRNAMSGTEQYVWAKRTVELINSVFPSADFIAWPICDQLLSHCLMCANWITNFEINTVDVVHLLNKTATYLQGRALYDTAQILYVKALKINRLLTVPSDSLTATVLNNLASLYENRGYYQQAQPLYIEALSIWKNQLDTDHPGMATSLNNLAGLYKSQCRYSDAEPLFVEALEIRKHQLGSWHPFTVTSLNNLADLYRSQCRYSDAEPLFIEAVEVCRTQLGTNHPLTATCLNNLAELYSDQNLYSDAEPLFIEALEISRTQLGADHPDTATSLNNLANLYRSLNRYSDAEILLIEALEIYRTRLGNSHPFTATSLNNLADLYCSQGRYGEAKPLYLEALEIRRDALDFAHPDIASSLNSLAKLYKEQSSYENAEALYLEALSIYRKQLSSNHPDMARSLNNLAVFYKTQGRYGDAVPLLRESLLICEKTFGIDHHNTAGVRHNYNALIWLLNSQQKQKKLKNWLMRLLGRRNSK